MTAKMRKYIDNFELQREEFENMLSRAGVSLNGAQQNELSSLNVSLRASGADHELRMSEYADRFDRKKFSEEDITRFKEPGRGQDGAGAGSGRGQGGARAGPERGQGGTRAGPGRGQDGNMAGPGQGQDRARAGRGGARARARTESKLCQDSTRARRGKVSA